MTDENSFTMPGRLIQPINPTISSAETGWYLFQSTVLVTLAASIFQQLTSSNIKNVPKITSSKEYPYHEASGELSLLLIFIYINLHDFKHHIGSACFLCSDDKSLVDIGTSDCPQCSPTITLDLSQGQRVLEHIGAHVLHDPSIDRSMPLCGLCLRPSPLCQFFLKKGKGANASLTVNQVMSKGCLMKLKYSYGVASKSTTSSPCSNVLIHCPLCPKSDAAIWRYFFKVHFQQRHPNAPFAQYEHIWKLTNFETTEMKRIWAHRMKVPVKRTKKSKIAPLTISEDHRAQIPTRYFIIITSPSSPCND